VLFLLGLLRLEVLRLGLLRLEDLRLGLLLLGDLRLGLLHLQDFLGLLRLGDLRLGDLLRRLGEGLRPWFFLHFCLRAERPLQCFIADFIEGREPST
jgi:hypothetical protein